LLPRSDLAVYRILEGAKASRLPVEQPTKFEFVDQPGDRQGTQNHGPAIAAPARGRGDSVMDRSGLVAPFALLGAVARQLDFLDGCLSDVRLAVVGRQRSLLVAPQI
jgi:hypothetical protein